MPSLDQTIVIGIRKRFKGAHCEPTIAATSDAELLETYACWHVYCAQDWNEFPLLVSKSNRLTAYMQKRA